jgi:hypothetical protein
MANRVFRYRAQFGANQEQSGDSREALGWVYMGASTAEPGITSRACSFFP